MGCVMWGCNSSPLGRFSALKSVLVRIYLILILLLLETGLGAVFTSLVGPGTHTACSYWRKAVVLKTLWLSTVAENLLWVICEIQLWISLSKYLHKFCLPRMLLGSHPPLPLLGVLHPGRQLTGAWVPQDRSGKARRNIFTRTLKRHFINLFYLPNLFKSRRKANLCCKMTP